MELGKIFEFTIHCPFLTEKVYFNYILYGAVMLAVLFKESFNNFSGDVVRFLYEDVWDVERGAFNFGGVVVMVGVSGWLFDRLVC
jgi:hypothetical protein